MVGQRDLARHWSPAFKGRYQRFVFEGDLVCRLPPRGKHFGSLVWKKRKEIKRTDSHRVIKDREEEDDKNEIAPVTDEEFQAMKNAVDEMPKDRRRRRDDPFRIKPRLREPRTTPSEITLTGWKIQANSMPSIRNAARPSRRRRSEGRSTTSSRMPKYKPIDLGFSTADAEQPQLQFVRGDIHFSFVDWQGQVVEFIASDVRAFSWLEESDIPDIRDDAAYEVLESDVIQNYCNQQRHLPRRRLPSLQAVVSTQWEYLTSYVKVSN